MSCRAPSTYQLAMRLQHLPGNRYCCLLARASVCLLLFAVRQLLCSLPALNHLFAYYFHHPHLFLFIIISYFVTSQFIFLFRSSHHTSRVERTSARAFLPYLTRHTP